VLAQAEVVCLAVAQQLLGIASERRWISHARKHLAGMFPFLPTQSGYGKRIRSVEGLLSAVEALSYAGGTRLAPPCMLPAINLLMGRAR
jgi:hypothetical protein